MRISVTAENRDVDPGTRMTSAVGRRIIGRGPGRAENRCPDVPQPERGTCGPSHSGQARHAESNAARGPGTNAAGGRRRSGCHHSMALTVIRPSSDRQPFIRTLAATPDRNHPAPDYDATSAQLTTAPRPTGEAPAHHPPRQPPSEPPPRRRMPPPTPPTVTAPSHPPTPTGTGPSGRPSLICHAAVAERSRLSAPPRPADRRRCGTVRAVDHVRLVLTAVSGPLRER
jgi:hypothetical protein